MSKPSVRHSKTEAFDFDSDSTSKVRPLETTEAGTSREIVEAQPIQQSELLISAGRTLMEDPSGKDPSIPYPFEKTITEICWIIWDMSL